MKRDLSFFEYAVMVRLQIANAQQHRALWFELA